MSTSKECRGEHRFFALEHIAIEPTGKVIIPIVCTACGELKIHEIHALENKVNAIEYRTKI